MRTTIRTRLPLVALVALAASGCAAGDGGADASVRDSGVMDANLIPVDAGPPPSDSGPPDAGPPDAGPPDGGPPEAARTCEACEEHADCATGSFCVSLSVGGRACVPSCEPDLPSCPRAFSCVLDIASGVDTTVCLPVGGACCVDEDADEHGLGVGCLGPDCNDLDSEINPAASEICDGVDQDCDGTADDPPTDCGSGRCADEGDGTYSSVTGADCTAAMCESGTVTDCTQYTCVDGGELGNTCATTCAPDGTDDDSFCIASAHCDGGACEPDVPNGGMCGEDSDCVSAHCENGFCCDSGACCAETADCPGGGGVVSLCDTARTCQGTRGETMCGSDFRCVTMSGIEDDSACDTGVEAKTCGLYDPVSCTGEADQMEPDCPESCTLDSDCVDAAHCEFGFCVPDRPPGGSCSRPDDCQTGLSCADGVCCTSDCGGTCNSCALPLSRGTCSPIPAGADPAGECPGFSCGGYFDGFGAGENICYRRQDISESAAVCNGASACVDAATACATQPRGPAQITCHSTCQTPTAGTCNGTTAGTCDDLDATAGNASCGTGACERTVQACTGGAPTPCTPGIPIAETCNGIDDDCNDTVDNGPDSLLCPPPMVGVTTACQVGVCRLECPSGRADIDGNYANGCECTDDGGGGVCGAALALGSLSTAGSSLPAYTGTLLPGTDDWFSVTFPSGGRGPGNGAPRISVSNIDGGPNPFRLSLYGSCLGFPGSPLGNCNSPGDAPNADGVVSFTFQDNASTPGPRAHTTSLVSWPSTIVFRVARSGTSTSCDDASYTLTVSR
ncbi:MAG: putative metal-binding motif-containing protein [Sandaracinaceae bacterium]